MLPSNRLTSSTQPPRAAALATSSSRLTYTPPLSLSLEVLALMLHARYFVSRPSLFAYYFRYAAI